MELTNHGHPQSRAVYQLATFFYMIDADLDGEANVDMAHSGCDLEASLCGSPACHAGWFGMFYTTELWPEPLFQSWQDYANKMAKFLGFTWQDDLEIWARGNKDIWGNIDGDDMFYNRCAFGIFNGKVITLKHIADHWTGVADRLFKIEMREAKS